jgi:hypothetical protein
VAALRKAGSLVLLSLAFAGCGDVLGNDDSDAHDRIFSVQAVKNCLDSTGLRTSSGRREVRNGPPIVYVSDGSAFLQLAIMARAEDARTATHGQSPGDSESRRARGNILYTWIGLRTTTREGKFDSCVPPA